jgi:hypothetical protein
MPWRWPQFFWFGLLTQFAAGIILGITIASANSDPYSGQSANPAGIIIGAIVGWIGTIWLLVGIGAWAVQVGTLNLRGDVHQLREHMADRNA